MSTVQTTITYTKLDGNGEEVSAGGLGNGITTLDTREVDEAGLDDTLLALGGPDHLLGKSKAVRLCLIPKT